MASFPFLGPELMYSDPPYLHATGRSAQRYRFDYEEADHIALLELLTALPCQVTISAYPSALYDAVDGAGAVLEWPQKSAYARQEGYSETPTEPCVHVIGVFTALG